MNLEELKAILKEKIDRVNDEDTLYLLGNLLDNNDEKIFKLTPEQKEKINFSLEQIEQNEVRSNKDVFSGAKQLIK
jgi:sensor histidine kinase regulating citrate/malate metabolism